MSLGRTSFAVVGAMMTVSTGYVLAEARQPVCFTAADNHRLTFPVFVQAPPPKPGEAGYRFYPATAAATMRLGTLVDARGIDGYVFHWANRANVPLAGDRGQPIERKLNLQPTSRAYRQQRTGFSSVERANACSMAQVFGFFGQARQAVHVARAAHIALASETSQADVGPTGPPDTCVMVAHRVPPSTTGVVLDYEVADGRTPAQTRQFLVDYAAAVHAAGRRAVLLTNPLNAPTQRFTGIDRSNAATIARAFDLTTLMLWGRNVEHSLSASYRAQRAIVDADGAVDHRRLMIDFELASTSLADAAFVHDTIVHDGLGGLMLWRDRAVVGGDCQDPVNRKIALAAFGDASVAARRP